MTDNIIQFRGRGGRDISYDTIKRFDPVEDGSHIVLAKGKGPEGESYAVIIVCGVEGGEPFDIIKEFQPTELGKLYAEMCAVIADKTLTRYIMMLPETDPVA